MNVDTIAALTDVPDLDVSVFQAVAGSASLTTGEVQQRYILNLDGEYAPRATYYATTGTLRVEWAASRLSVDEADVWVREVFGVKRSVREWRCQRVDYAVDLNVEQVPEYLAALSRLQLSTWQRHPFAGQGVVWKAKSRWAKFYNKRTGVIRFEVSNYRDAVRYMASRWFGCERTVQEMMQPGRALYVLAYYWQRLGLGQGIGAEQGELYALREAFGRRNIASAQHALHCIQEHGTESYKGLQLISKSSYYRWLKALREHGFLSMSESVLPALHLPLERFFDASLAQNLKGSDVAPLSSLNEKNSREKWWFLSQVMGFNPKNPEIKYLQERFDGWAAKRMDASARSVPGSGAISAIRDTGTVAIAGTGT